MKSGDKNSGFPVSELKQLAVSWNSKFLKNEIMLILPFFLKRVAMKKPYSTGESYFLKITRERRNK